jgi:hypothetical protein
MAFGTTIERRDFIAKTSLRVVFTAQDAICPDGAQLMERGKTLGRHSVRHQARTPGRAKPKDDGQRTMDREVWIANSVW